MFVVMVKKQSIRMNFFIHSSYQNIFLKQYFVLTKAQKNYFFFTSDKILGMNEAKNCQWRVARRPEGNVVTEDFEYREIDIPEIQDGEVLLKTLYLNLAPVMRMYMSGESAAGEQSLDIGDVIHGRGVAEIIESKHSDYKEGEIVQGQMGWQTYKASKMTDALSAPVSCAITGTSLRSPHTCNCSTAAARKVSPAANMTEYPSDPKRLLSFPTVVVFPHPLTPTIKMTNGLCFDMVRGCSTGLRTPCKCSLS